MALKEKKGVLYIIVCAAPPASYVQDFIEQTLALRWETCVIATPQAMQFINDSLLTTLTGHKVRSTYKQPGEPDALPKADVIVVVPATFNTINKWATGIADTLAVGILCEALGRTTTPIIAVPCLKSDLISHPVFPRNIAFLQQCGVRVLHEPQYYPSPKIVPWTTILHALDDATYYHPS